MTLIRMAQIVNDKAQFFDDQELAFVAQQLELYANLQGIPRRRVRPTYSPAEYVGVQRAAEMVSLSRSYIKSLVASGNIPSVKVGSRRLIAVSDLRAFVGGSVS